VGVIVMITGLNSKSESIKSTAFMIFIFGALSAISAMTTGEGAEEVVEKIGGVTESYIKSLEETAETFALLSYLLGGISLIGLWARFKQSYFFAINSIGTLVFAFVIIFYAKQTGTAGGELRHTEIRSGIAFPALENNNAEVEDKI